LINKFVFSLCEGHQFYFTTANFIDLTIFGLVVWWWKISDFYTVAEIDFPLFGEPDDKEPKVNLMRNVILNAENEEFHTDYLLASITSLLWFRCILLLRLNEYFGPIIEMIKVMVILVNQFMILYLLELFTFSCIATLTMNDNPSFDNLFESMRTYLTSSLGTFDLEMYDKYDGFKGYFGLVLHILVLFINMILIINLLIAIMSDTYS